jgi:hypothetical protein
MAVNEEDKDIESVAQPDADYKKSIDDLGQSAVIRAEMRDYERLKLENKSKIVENKDKIEIDNVGSALAKQFSQLNENQQSQVLSNIGLVEDKTSPKDSFKSLSDEERKAFMEETGY